MKYILPILVLLAFIGCAPKQVTPEAKTVQIVYDAPDKSACEFVGEVIGSQGNWLTGDYTSNKNLIIGARNELRNEAFKMGANVVYMETMESASAWGSLGTTNTTVIGQAYNCR